MGIVRLILIDFRSLELPGSDSSKNAFGIASIEDDRLALCPLKHLRSVEVDRYTAFSGRVENERDQLAWSELVEGFCVRAGVRISTELPPPQ